MDAARHARQLEGRGELLQNNRYPRRPGTEIVEAGKLSGASSAMDALLALDPGKPPIRTTRNQ